MTTTTKADTREQRARESSIEGYLCRRVEALGGIAEKTRAIGSRGYFDRVVVLPPLSRVPRSEPALSLGYEGSNGRGLSYEQIARYVTHASSVRVIFVELKRPKGGRLSIHQTKRHERYRQLGAEVAVLWTRVDVDALLGADR